MNFLETIEKPWRHPVDYLQLVFWFVIFVIVAVAMADGLRALAAFMADTAKEAVS